MFIETVLIILILSLSFFLVGVPAVKIIRSLLPKAKVDPVVAARIRLETAQKEVEAARLDKEAEKIYDHMYEELINDSEDSKNRRRI